MTTNRGMITAGQLFVLLFISRAIVTITYSPELSSGDDMWNHLLSAIFAFPLSLIMLIPTLLLWKLNRDMSVLEYGEDIFKRLSIIISLFYALYFIMVCGYGIALYNKFVSLGVNGEAPVFAVAVAVLVASCYGAFKGVEAIARASGLILIGLIATVLILIFALTPSINTENYRTILSTGYISTYNGTILMLSRMSCIPAIAVLYPIVKGNIAKGSVLWCSSIFILVMISIILVTGSLGDYLKNSVFPVYQAAKTVNIGFLQRLDALFIGLWTAGLFCRLSLFLYLFALCVGKAFGKRASCFAIIVGGTAILIFGTVTADMGFTSFIFNINFWLWFTLVSAVFIPIFLLICYVVKTSGKKNKTHKKSGAKALILTIGIGLTVLTFSGCMSRAELNEKVIVEGIGIDKENDKYTLTAMVLNIKSTEEALPPNIISASGGSVAECFDNISRNTGRQVMLSSNRFIAMNKTAATVADEVLSYFNNSFEARPDALIYVTEGNTANILSNEKVLDTMTAEDIAMIGGDYSNGTVKACEYKEYKASDNSGIYDIAVPILMLDESKAQIVPDGVALFCKGKMSGTLTTNESIILNILSDNVSGAVILLNDDKKTPIKIVSAKSENNISHNKDIFNYSKNLEVSLELPEGSNSQNKKLLEEVEKFLKKSCCETAEKAIKTYNSDILRIGKKAQNGFYYDFEKIKDWHEALQFVKLDFSVKANFVRS